VSTPEIRRLRAQIAGTARHQRDDFDLPILRHRLAVERAAVALAVLSQRRLTEDGRARLRGIINGWLDTGTAPRCDPAGPGSHPYTSRPGETASYAS
jgi:hypothetical protein